MIAVVIPCYRVTDHIGAVLAEIPALVERIYCIDDCCPDGSGDHIEARCADPRVTVLRHDHNQGVGGAVVTGYRRALADGASVVVKIDGDGQMDPSLIEHFIAPILAGKCDYTKGNRFFRLSDAREMPFARMFGNLALGFLTKLSSGYWTVFDPTNGYTAIHAKVLRHLPLDRIAPRYFFESDMLFQLYLLRCTVIDIPMAARYSDETSNLRVGRVILPFLGGHLRNFARRLLYSYFFRDFNLASLEILAGLPLFVFGVFFGAVEWVRAVHAGEVATAGTVMLGALPVILGFQLLLSAIHYDIAAVPRQAIHPQLPNQ